jgi:hypothetical protein
MEQHGTDTRETYEEIERERERERGERKERENTDRNMLYTGCIHL